MSCINCREIDRLEEARDGQGEDNRDRGNDARGRAEALAVAGAAAGEGDARINGLLLVIGGGRARGRHIGAHLDALRAREERLEASAALGGVRVSRARAERSRALGGLIGGLLELLSGALRGGGGAGGGGSTGGSGVLGGGNGNNYNAMS